MEYVMISILNKADVFIVPCYIPKRDADELFHILSTRMQWRLTTYGEGNPSSLPEGTTDTYYSPASLPPVIAKAKLNRIKANIARTYQMELERFDLNHYPSPSVGLTYHRDNDCIGDKPMATLSLGYSRKIWFRDLETNEEFAFLLNSGDLLIMGKDSQFKYEHGLKQETGLIGGRISVNFRPPLNCDQ